MQAAATSQIESTDDPKERKALEKRVDDRAKRVARRAELEELRSPWTRSPGGTATCWPRIGRR